MVRSPLDGQPPVSCDSECHGYQATDWAVRSGTPVYAKFSGRFYRRGPYPDLGDRDPGLCGDVEAPGLFGRSAHLSRWAVPNGAWVAEGDVIGYSGNTGYSFGPHLHDYVVVDGIRYGTADYLNQIGYAWAQFDFASPLPAPEAQRKDPDMPELIKSDNGYGGLAYDDYFEPRDGDGMIWGEKQYGPARVIPNEQFIGRLVDIERRRLWKLKTFGPEGVLPVDIDIQALAEQTALETERRLADDFARLNGDVDD